MKLEKQRESGLVILKEIDSYIRRRIQTDDIYLSIDRENKERMKAKSFKEIDR